jgi:broad specificity phosphatase PhoE
MVRIRLALLLMACSGALAAANIILVRHADRMSGMSRDVLLSPAGEERARQLAEALKDANIQRIYVTEVRRTEQTAEPLAERLHRKPIVIAKDDVDMLVSELRKLSDDETALVVGHADTVPVIVERLGGGSVPAFRDNEYDRMIVLFTGAGRKPRVLTLRYGKATP